jgi:hypothetical protein
MENGAGRFGPEFCLSMSLNAMYSQALFLLQVLAEEVNDSPPSHVGTLLFISSNKHRCFLLLTLAFPILKKLKKVKKIQFFANIFLET